MGILLISGVNAQGDSSAFVVHADNLQINENDNAQLEEKIKRDLQSQKSKRVSTTDAVKQNRKSPAWNYLLNAPEPNNEIEKRWSKKAQAGGKGYPTTPTWNEATTP